MFSRAITSVIGLVVFFVPLVSFAQSTCPSLTRSLFVGTRGEDVRQLQQFLISKGELSSDYATGYFGALTEEAVGRWQEGNGVILSRSDQGFGVVGPKTRAAIAARCTKSAISGGGISETVIRSVQSAGSDVPGVTKCSVNLKPKTPCTSYWQGRRGPDGCVTSWYCVAVATRYLISASSTGVIASSTSTTTSVTSSASTPPNTNLYTSPSDVFTYWCSNGVGDFGYWSVTPCPISTPGGTYGSSANVQEGTVCGPEGRQEFVACQYMQNCPSGGTYLICENALWKRF